LTGRPARADKLDPPSSAILAYNAITQNGFRGHVYYEDGSETIDIDVAQLLEENEAHLVAQMLAIEKRMDEEEHQFRTEQSERALASCFDDSFSYLVERLYCNLSDAVRVGQAQAHAAMIHERMVSLRRSLAERGFQTPAASLDLDRIVRGLGLLEGIM